MKQIDSDKLKWAIRFVHPRDLEALRMRSEGMKWRQIGEALKISKERARQISLRACNIIKYKINTADEIFELTENNRSDSLSSRFTSRFFDGD